MKLNWKTTAAGALVGLVALLLYFTVSGDYAFLNAAVYTGSPTGEYHSVGEKLAARARKAARVLQTAQLPKSRIQPALHLQCPHCMHAHAAPAQLAALTPRLSAR